MSSGVEREMAALWVRRSGPPKQKSDAEEFLQEYFQRNCQAEETRERDNQAAIRIQSWFRSCKVQACLSHLHKNAIIIQKIWRGFSARARVRQMVKAAYFILKMNFYDEMAVRIQRRWKGFFVRKYIHNFYGRKNYLERVTLTNYLVRKELDELEELQRRERSCLEKMKEQSAKVHQAYRLHHLLSTSQCPGVFNSPFSSAPKEMELLLRQVKYRNATKLASRSSNSPMSIPCSADPGFTETPKSPWMKRTCCSKPILPPITIKKDQDPFREPGEMWGQRVHCPDMMLSLQTAYTHLEEARNQRRNLKSERLGCDKLFSSM